MTLDEAIKHAEEVAVEHTKYNRYGGFESCDKCAEEHRQLADWLKELKQLREQTQWIPFSVNTMPKEGTDCLITIKGKDGICTTEKSKLFDFTYWQGFGRDIEVTAWMSLPEPYKAEGSGEE